MTKDATDNEEQQTKAPQFSWVFVVGVLTVVIGAIGVAVALQSSSAIFPGSFKTVSYANGKEGTYKLQFYKAYSIEKSGENNKLVSKISKEDKYPVTLSIVTADRNAYEAIKACKSYRKVMTVQNNIVKQPVVLCAAPETGGIPDVVYVGGFTHGKQAYIVTIGQDFSGAQTTETANQATDDSAADPQSAMAKLGLDPYKEDIGKIISSIGVE